MFADRYLRFPKRVPGRNIAWPVWIWTVYIPGQPRVQLNLLARTVLKFIAAGCTDEARIAQHLGVERDLVLYIMVSELVPNGWLSTNYRTLTDEGRALLDDSVAAARELQVGFVFQSAWSGKLWPRFSAELPELEVNPRTPGRRLEFIEDRASGKAGHAFVLEPRTGVSPQAPTADEVWDAVRQHKLDRYNRRTLAEQDEGSFHITNVRDRLDFIDPEPLRGYVLCGARKGREQPWNVTDPLGVLEAPQWMREEVYDACRTVPPLAQALVNVLGEINTSQSWDEYRAATDEAARLEAFESFPNAAHIPLLPEILVELLRARRIVEAAGGTSSSSDVGNLALQAQRALECACAWALAQWPLDVPQRLPSKHARRHEVRSALSLAVPELPQSILDELCCLRPGKIFYAVKNRSESLRPLLAGVLFTFVDHPDHPLRAIAADEEFLSRVLTLSHDRDSVGHANGRTVARERALGHAETALSLIRTLLQENYDGQKEQSEDPKPTTAAG